VSSLFYFLQEIANATIATIAHEMWMNRPQKAVVNIFAFDIVKQFVVRLTSGLRINQQLAQISKPPLILLANGITHGFARPVARFVDTAPQNFLCRFNVAHFGCHFAKPLRQRSHAVGRIITKQTRHIRGQTLATGRLLRLNVATKSGALGIQVAVGLLEFLLLL
jgi:hypothetical protein